MTSLALSMPSLPELVIKGKIIPVPIFQGGMGIGVSLASLAGAVAREGGVGIISSAALDRILSKRVGKAFDIYNAVREEIGIAKDIGKYIGINIMVAVARDFRDSVRAAIDAGVDAIVSGGGIPLDLPAVQPPKDTALIPIVSSARSLDLICRKWERYGYRPDAAVLEGPLAGGHLGFKLEQVDSPEYALEKLFPPVKEVAMKHGDFPVIVAGGIYTHDDILNFIGQGADGVQIGTRFLATQESSASEEYKKAVVEAKKDDLVVAVSPGSPCGLPFRVIKKSPMFLSALVKRRNPKCSLGYVLSRDAEGRYTVCSAKKSNEHSFCICNGLLSSGAYGSDGEEQLYTVGTNACRVDKILSVKKLMDELKGRNG